MNLGDIQKKQKSVSECVVRTRNVSKPNAINPNIHAKKISSSIESNSGTQQISQFYPNHLDMTDDSSLTILKNADLYSAIIPFHVPFDSSLTFILNRENLIFPKDCSWESQLNDRSILKKMNKKEIKRQELCQEFIMTEKSFVEKLIILKILYKDEMLISDLFDVQFIELLFPHIEKLIACQLIFIHAMEKSKVDHVYKNFIDQVHSFVTSSYGGLMKVLLLFSCAVHLTTVKKFMDLVKEDSKVAAAFKKMEAHPDLKKNDFKTIMANVFQRPPRYTLLINGVIETFGTADPDELRKHAECKEYFEQLNANLNQFLGERMKHMTLGTIERYLDLRKLEPAQAQKIQDLRISEQPLKYEFSVMTLKDKKQHQPVDLLVFEKFILITKKTDGNTVLIYTQNNCIAYLDLKMVLIRDFPQEENALVIIDQSPIPNLWVILCKSKSQKKECMEKMNDAVESLNANKETKLLIQEYYTRGQLQTIFNLHHGKPSEVFLKRRVSVKKSISSSKSITNVLSLVESTKISASADDINSTRISNIQGIDGMGSGLINQISQSGQLKEFKDESDPSKPKNKQQMSLSSNSAYKKKAKSIGAVKRIGSKSIHPSKNATGLKNEENESIGTNESLAESEISKDICDQATVDSMIDHFENAGKYVDSSSEDSVYSATTNDGFDINQSEESKDVSPDSMMIKSRINISPMSPLSMERDPVKNFVSRTVSVPMHSDELSIEHLDSLGPPGPENVSYLSYDESIDGYLSYTTINDNSVSPCESNVSLCNNSASSENVFSVSAPDKRKSRASILKRSLHINLIASAMKSKGKSCGELVPSVSTAESHLKTKAIVNEMSSTVSSIEILTPTITKTPLQLHRSKHHSFTERFRRNGDSVGTNLHRHSISGQSQSSISDENCISEAEEPCDAFTPSTSNSTDPPKQCTKKPNVLRRMLSRSSESSPS